MSSIRTAKMAELLGVTPQTVRKYAENNEIPYHRSPTGQLFFTEEDVKQALGDDTSTSTPQVKVHYARSSSGDNTIIDHQFEKLEEYYGAPDIKIKDKASGLNENRKGLQKLIKLANTGEITDIYMVRKDRLTRFGYKYLEELFRQNNVNIHYMVNQENTSAEQELMDDFMAIIASFSGKHSQLRSQEAKKKLLEKALHEVDGENNE